MVLRTAVAAHAISQGVCIVAGSSKAFLHFPALGLLAIIAGGMCLVGFLTPIAAGTLALSYVLQNGFLLVMHGANKHSAAYEPLYLVAMCTALALLGPGAFSMDGRLFGRIEIVIPESRRPSR